MAGYKLKQFNLERKPTGMTCVKEVVLPFNKFPGVDTRLGPEMRSTGEVMGICTSFGVAYYKSQMAANSSLPFSGNVFVSFSDKTKPKLMDSVRRMKKMGYNIIATRGTRDYLMVHGIESEFIHKAHDGSPNILDLIQDGKIDLIFNTPADAESRADEIAMHKITIQFKVPYLSTVPGIRASVNGLEHAKMEKLTVHALQDVLGYDSKTMPKLLK
jgi:carbamoyl-phosphate synthase large subunit